MYAAGLVGSARRNANAIRSTPAAARARAAAAGAAAARRRRAYSVLVRAGTTRVPVQLCAAAAITVREYSSCLLFWLCAVRPQAGSRSSQTT
jgi:hypothetical protein